MLNYQRVCHDMSWLEDELPGWDPFNDRCIEVLNLAGCARMSGCYWSSQICAWYFVWRKYWLVVYLPLPLWKLWYNQLGLWHSKPMESHSKHVANHQKSHGDHPPSFFKTKTSTENQQQLGHQQQLGKKPLANRSPDILKSHGVRV